ncbi:hypothetical protein PGTUg99_019422 [Puccinia graminis f. sp. tritici]|uniref:Uncharacterized protein n=1 Tax=Puccinia graminis f. sp. tritici TaxID=56615 RepID=A0A5B0Q1F0_PUCGR|nr:hypothetical protein PGTUg99_019422 [Puccinia graminis f. sp. tritici]
MRIRSDHQLLPTLKSHFNREIHRSEVVSAKSSSETTKSTPVASKETTKSLPDSESLSINGLAKLAKKPTTKPKKTSSKKIRSPEVVPSNWDSSNEVKSKSDKPRSKTSVAPELKKSLASSDPFKSNESITKLTNKELLNSIQIKKTVIDQTTVSANNPTEPAASKTKVNTGLNQSSQLFNPSSVVLTNVQPIQYFPKISGDAAVQKKIKNYFVPQGRTVRSESTTSSAQPSLLFTTEPYEPASESELDIITGATAQLWSKPKISKGRLGDDILARYPRPLHPLLQSVKLYQEYYQQATEKNNEDMKVVTISKASELQDELTDKIDSQDFKTLFGGWDPKAECQEYLTGPKGIPVTPTPDPEMQVNPPAEVPPLHQGTSQQYPQGYYSQQGYP